MRSPVLALAAAVAVVASPLAAQQPPAPAAAPAADPASGLATATRGDLTCAAAFAIAASEQQRGVVSALGLPPLAVRGKEFFVRTGAKAMDEAGLGREAVRALFEGEVARLQAQARDGGSPDAALAAVMPQCLVRLDAVVAPLAKPGLAQCAAIMQLAFEELRASEGLSARARDVMTLAAVLDAREREALKATGLSGTAVDRTMIENRERMVGETAAAEPGVERYDLQTCYELAKPDGKKHY